MHIEITEDTTIRLSDRPQDQDGHLLQGAVIVGAHVTWDGQR